MTLAVCVNCGAMKFGALVTCKNCHTSPLTTEDQFVYSMVLSDHYFTPDTLGEISRSMLRGERMPRLSTEQEREIRQQYLPEYERMKIMLGGVGAVTQHRATTFRNRAPRESNRPAEHAGSEFRFWTVALAALASALPLISLLQKLFSVGLAPFLRDSLTYYRHAVYPLVDTLQAILANVPWLEFYSLFLHKFVSIDAYRDLAVLSFLFAGAAFRVILRSVIASDATYRGWEEGVAAVVGMTLISLICLALALTLLALMLPLVAVAGTVTLKHNRFDLHPINGNPYWTFLFTLLLAFFAAGIFFVTNVLMTQY